MRGDNVVENTWSYDMTTLIGTRYSLDERRAQLAL